MTADMNHMFCFVY